MMSCYELIYALSPDMSAEVVDEFNNKVQSYITENSGKIEAFDPWGLKKFAYPVNRKLEGNFYLVKFLLDPKYILEIREMARLNEQVLRYNFMKIEKDYSLRKKKFRKFNNEEKEKEEIEAVEK